MTPSLMVQETPCDAKEAHRFPRDRAMGSGAVALRLTKLFSSSCSSRKNQRGLADDRSESRKLRARQDGAVRKTHDKASSLTTSTSRASGRDHDGQACTMSCKFRDIHRRDLFFD
ncbi:hypothetical protein HYR99_01155 [Candidatus Poribacteria bacterium]|nr:hypothetical protein [Candidatus Poribacteria bacterium]